MVSGLWIDQGDADARAATYAGWLGEALRAFIRDGYVIIPGTVEPEAVDAYRAELGTVIGTHSGLKTAFVDGFHAVEDADLHRPLTKVLDTFAFAPSALKLMFAPKIVEFLRAIFDDSILAHQGLHFEVGSTQAIHQDTSYVVVDKPLNLAASWIALEDIQEGTGELVYYPGSHRFPHQLYQGDKHWNPTRDGNEAHARHLAWLHEEAKARGIAQTSFLPKKGDALIWHADLAHGGGQITREGATRRSLVTHYCPLSNTPHYFQHATHCRKVPVGDNAISSFYYPLAHQQLEPV